jgi:phosphatidylglycerol lysyltransferase
MSAGNSLETHTTYIRRFGSGCLAFSTLQAGLRYFDAEGCGFIAFAPFRHPLLARRQVAIALADPVVAPGDYPRVADAFLAVSGPAIFAQVGLRFAEVLSRQGLRVNQCGTETEIPLAAFSMAGKAKAQLRHWVNKARKEGVTVEERGGAELPIDELRTVSDEWLAARGHRELFLLARPMVFAAEECVRYFLARKAGRLVAFIVFDPMFREGRVIGYYHNHIRFRGDAPTGTTDLITVTAAETFRGEGLEVLSLGFSPLAGLDPEPFRHNRVTRFTFRWVFQHGNRFYSFKNVDFHKRKYDGKTVPVFCASTRGMTLRDFACVLKCTGVL